MFIFVKILVSINNVVTNLYYDKANLALQQFLIKSKLFFMKTIICCNLRNKKVHVVIDIIRIKLDVLIEQTTIKVTGAA